MTKVGCCGFPVRREEYYDKFDIVELQTTFYNLPKPSTAIKWSSEAPRGFAHVLKAWQAITHPADSPTYRRTKIEIPKEKKKNYGHFKLTDEVKDAWDRTRETARVLRSEMVLFQSPPDFGEKPENILNVRSFFEKAERGGLVMVWEPRGGWEKTTVDSLCSDLDIVHCTDPFNDGHTEGITAYHRLHGKGGYGYRYSDGDLEELLGYCSDAEETYVMFNNMSMLEDALRFRFLTKKT
jgi:uncharacterized protein YecE (DUF72 family)